MFCWSLALKEGKGHLEHEATLPIYPPPPPPEEHPPPPPPKPPLVSHPHFFMAWGQDLPPVAPSSKDFPDHRKEVLSFQPPPPPAVKRREKAQVGIILCKNHCREMQNKPSFESTSAESESHALVRRGDVLATQCYSDLSVGLLTTSIICTSFHLPHRTSIFYRKCKKISLPTPQSLVSGYQSFLLLFAKNTFEKPLCQFWSEEKSIFSEKDVKTGPSPALNTTYQWLTFISAGWSVQGLFTETSNQGAIMLFLHKPGKQYVYTARNGAGRRMAKLAPQTPTSKNQTTFLMRSTALFWENIAIVMAISSLIPVFRPSV